MSKSAEVTICQGDLDDAVMQALLGCAVVAWDIETTGLEWKADRIGTCQLYNPEMGTTIVQLHDEIPIRLRQLISSEALLKVFHHAPFDLRFMAHQWKARPLNVACTKIAAKILMPGLDKAEYSLAPLLEHQLGVRIDKAQQRSNWTSKTLSKEQIAYAVSDVIYLLPLLENLKEKAVTRGVWHLIEASFSYLPTRVALDLMGVKDVFVY
jgi:ribonuclease D